MLVKDLVKDLGIRIFSFQHCFAVAFLPGFKSGCVILLGFTCCHLDTSGF